MHDSAQLGVALLSFAFSVSYGTFPHALSQVLVQTFGGWAVDYAAHTMQIEGWTLQNASKCCKYHAQDFSCRYFVQTQFTK